MIATPVQAISLIFEETGAGTPEIRGVPMSNFGILQEM